MDAEDNHGETDISSLVAMRVAPFVGTRTHANFPRMEYLRIRNTGCGKFSIYVCLAAKFSSWTIWRWPMAGNSTLISSPSVRHQRARSADRQIRSVPHFPSGSE